ncbi:hypothetical protein [Halobacteriovorax sp. HLS]|uniref:hypothetical protein n=1 Tax=Halobacteriovorax sp. HLS TaxID=2234000 RepID=UPI000FD96AE1|nr:hypothetical protein [Halobacteriovorax sp. HLS]
MRALIYLSMFVVMMMAFEVNAWDSFEEANVDVSPWIYNEESQITDWQDFTNISAGRVVALKIQEKKLQSSNTVVAVTQKVTNVSETPYCLLSSLNDQQNAINTFKNGGKTLVLPGEEKLIGGYRVNKLGKSWKVNWKMIATKNLARCY